MLPGCGPRLDARAASCSVRSSPRFPPLDEQHNYGDNQDSDNFDAQHQHAVLIEEPAQQPAVGIEGGRQHQEHGHHEQAAGR